MDLKRELVSPEQLRYADWLDGGTKIGLCLLLVSFALYASGVVEPHIPLSELPARWVLPVRQYLAATGLPSGGGWRPMTEGSAMTEFLGRP